MMHTFRCLLVGVVLACVCASVSLAQPTPEPPQGREWRPGEVAKLFDAYAIVQAQERLGLTEDQYARFVSRFTALQEVRRRHEAERFRHLRELMSAADETSTDDAALAARLKALSDLQASADDEIRQAMASVDEVLTVRQQARFRVFENQLERRKLELMMRARQAPRPPERRQVPRQR